MLPKVWHDSCLRCLAWFGDKTEVKVSDAQPAAETKEVGKPVTGDWLVIHSLSDPEQLNPLTSNDASSSEVNGYIFETLLTRDPRAWSLNRHRRGATRNIRGQAHLYI